MLTLTCRDEPEVLAPLFADPAVAPEPIAVAWRLMRFLDFEAVLILEDEGGGTLDERNLGAAREELKDVLPAECWPDLEAMIDEARDAAEFGAECRREQEVWR